MVQNDEPIYGEWVATLDGYVNANIQAQVHGYLIKQNYREGSFVHKDDILFEIDQRPLEAVLGQANGQLAQARGQLAQAQGQLAQAQAQFGLANINVKRDTPLAAARAIAQSQLDNDNQTLAQAEALVKTDNAAIQAAEATIQAAQAAVETAQLNLGFTKVRSLIDGDRRTRHRADGESGQPHHRLDDGRIARSDQSVFLDQRAAVYGSVRAAQIQRRRYAAAGQRSSAAVDALERQHLSTFRQNRFRRSSDRSANGHDPHRRNVSRIQEMFCDPASSAAFAR